MAVFSQTAGSKKGLFSILVSKYLHDRDTQSWLDAYLRPGAALSWKMILTRKPCPVDIDAFPGLFVSPEILCHQQSGFTKGPDICLILETLLFVRKFISQLPYQSLFLKKHIFLSYCASHPEDKKSRNVTSWVCLQFFNDNLALAANSQRAISHLMIVLYYRRTKLQLHHSFFCFFLFQQRLALFFFLFMCTPGRYIRSATMGQKIPQFKCCCPTVAQQKNHEEKTHL